jgi:hypothetical protein
MTSDDPEAEWEAQKEVAWAAGEWASAEECERAAKETSDAEDIRWEAEERAAFVAKHFPPKPEGTQQMTDVNDIFSLSDPPVVAPAPVAAPATGNGRRKRAASGNGETAPVKRGGRPKGSKNKPRDATGLMPNPVSAPAKRRGRPKGYSPKRAAAPTPSASIGNGPVKIDLSVALAVFTSLKTEDVTLTSKLVQVLSGIDKDSRTRILEAVGKVFA